MKIFSDVQSKLKKKNSKPVIFYSVMYLKIKIKTLCVFDNNYYFMSELCSLTKMMATEHRSGFLESPRKLLWPVQNTVRGKSEGFFD